MQNETTVKQQEEIIDVEVVNETTPKANGKAKDFALVSYDARGTSLSVSHQAATIINLIHGTDKDGNKLMPDDKLKAFFGSVVETERAAFVLRGAAASELIDRLEALGAESNQTEGVNTALREVAKDAGVDVGTLREDSRIYKEFAEDLVELLAANPERILGREYYRLALQTGNVTWASPREVLNYFQEQLDSLTYSSSFARRDVKRINDGMTIDEVRAADLKEREAALGTPSRAGTTAKAKMLNIQVEQSDKMQWVISQVLKTGSNMTNWILRKGKEQFGDMPKPEKPKVDTKAKTKGKTAKGKSKTTAKGKGKGVAVSGKTKAPTGGAGQTVVPVEGA